MTNSNEDHSSSFTAEKINSTTFVIKEDDAEFEHPYIYAKLHPKYPVLILSDTGCDAPKEKYQNAKYTHLRDFLENCPIDANDNKPFNPNGEREYVIICTHCHFDHIGGVEQFVEKDGTTSIVASAAGRDFIESDLTHHGLFDMIGKPAPKYKVTHWAQAFSKLKVPNPSAINGNESVDLGITILHTPGHTPDQLAWYDHEEMHLYVGDSMYEEGTTDKMPVVWPVHGNLVEWVFSLQKMLFYVRSLNAKAAAASEASSGDDDDDEKKWVQVSKRVKLGAGHQTHSIDAEEFLDRNDKFLLRILKGEIPGVEWGEWAGEKLYHWREEDGKSGISFRAPKRLMEEAYDFFKGIYY